MNKETNRKTVLWEGFRKELPWILFWILLVITAYGYYQDKQICEEVLSDPCKACYKLNQTLIDFEYINPEDIYPGNTYADIIINDSLIPPEDKNPNSRTILDYK